MASLPGTDASMPCVTAVVASASAGAPGELWEGRSQVQEVAPRVFLTNFFGARKKDLLAAAGITHVRTSVRECSVACCPSHELCTLSAKGVLRRALGELVLWENWEVVASWGFAVACLYSKREAYQAGRWCTLMTMPYLECRCWCVQRSYRLLTPPCAPTTGFLLWTTLAATFGSTSQLLLTSSAQRWPQVCCTFCSCTLLVLDAASRGVACLGDLCGEITQSAATTATIKYLPRAHFVGP